MSTTPPARRLSAGTGPSSRPSATRTPAGRPPARRDSRRPAGSSPAQSRPAQNRPAGNRPQPAEAPTAAALRTAAQRSREARADWWFAQQLVLVLSGQRPVHTILRHLRGPAFDELHRLAEGSPLRPRGAHRGAPQLVSVRGMQPRSGVIEAFAHIRTGERRRAMAFRLESGPDLRWRCAAVELDGLPG